MGEIESVIGYKALIEDHDKKEEAWWWNPLWKVKALLKN